MTSHGEERPGVIDVRGLVKRYGRTVAVDDLTFRVEPGRITGFLGPNGAGKSSTLRMILGLDHPNSGNVLINGRSYVELEEPLRHVGALLDAGAVHGGRTARDHLRILALSNRIPGHRIDEVLCQVGLASAAGRRIRGFSLGMRQRLGMAVALLGEPRVLLLDEPLNGLDPEGILWLRTLLKDFAGRGGTVLVSSHLMNEMAVTADHLVIIGRGRLLADLGMDDFRATYGHGGVRLRTTEPARIRDLLVAKGFSPRRMADGAWEVPEARLEDVGPLAAREGIPLLELSLREASLEAAFLSMTASDAEYTTEPGRKAL